VGGPVLGSIIGDGSKLGRAIAGGGDTIGDVLTPDERKRFDALSEAYPDWMPSPNAEVTVLTPPEVREARRAVAGSGHHRHPIAFGGDPNPPDGLVETGETRTEKNPIHGEISRIWYDVLRRVRGGD
jgi:hypothetical protein